ncbi:small integral membrane protein 22 isoform X2 [Manis pentadactyla]|uniref:small integral membrane protein 22 isoform X2 n=1 Tax=Manis pentadactyla TaxID=143292 RepID=UPI00255C8D8F|nr:small integral membrane protein 22 isoform X2 [Manis pentadactyla]
MTRPTGPQPAHLAGAAPPARPQRRRPRRVGPVAGAPPARTRKRKAVRSRRNQGLPGSGRSEGPPAGMAASAETLQEELQTVAQEVLGKLRSRRLFQSEWDTAAFVVFLLFAGTVLLLLLLACTHCCCCRPRRGTLLSQKERTGVDNLALEP